MNAPESPDKSLTVIDALKIFAIFLIFSLAINLINHNIIKATPKTPLGLLYFLFFTHILGILAPVITYIYSKGYNLNETLNMRPVSVPALFGISFISIGFFVALNIFQGLIEPLFRPYEEGMAAYQEFLTTIASASRTPLDVFLLLLCIGIIPAVAEEILFRGIILNGLKNSSTATKAIVLAGLLFGIIHLFPPQVIVVSLLGIFFGILTIRTNSIVTSIWCHFLNNTLIILMMWWSTFNP